jgi:regulator of nucleoside diphosphate kinase
MPETSILRREVVYPEQYVSADAHVSVLSPLGTALLGLSVGSQMPYFTSAGWMHLVRIESVSRSGPDVIPLFLRGRNAAAGNPASGDDPGPVAA